MNYPKVVLLKGNGPISINNELVELLPVTTAHGCIGFPLKALHAQKVYLVSDLARFWEIHKEIREKPCCFVYSYEPLDEEERKKISAEEIVEV